MENTGKKDLAQRIIDTHPELIKRSREVQTKRDVKIKTKVDKLLKY